MIRKISTVSIFVTDYDAAKAFYTEKPSFEVRRAGRRSPTHY
jgi:catechol 2,3-dioxygenase-like lactoylglutathione lyase family enzyme